MADHLHCSSCKEDLSLLDIENETRIGLASIFTVRCRECLALTSVPTDRMDQGATGEQRAFINEQAVSGAIKAGLDYTSFNHFLSILEIPNMTEEIFKNFEREIRPIVENADNDVSAQANKEEMVKSEAGE